MKIEDIDKSLISKWDYLGWKRWTNFKELGDPQKDWNQTVMTRINEISAGIHQGTCIYNEKTGITEELGPADTIMMNDKFLQVMNSLEFFNTEKNSLGRKQVIIDNTIEDNIIFVFRKDVPDDYERKNRTAGAIRIENFEQIEAGRGITFGNKTAFLTGITGQDGSYLAELLLDKGYTVHAIIRRASTFNTGRIDHLMKNKNLILHYGDMTDPTNIMSLISKVNPDEIYNLAAQSHVKVSFEIPHYTAQVDALGTLTILEAMRAYCPNAKFYQASTSELYGGLSYNKNNEGLYDENTPFHPRSPYGVAKLYGFWIIKNYREAYGLFACNGILFNHESERRGKTFVTRKITTNMVQVKKGKRDVLTIGNLDAERDWGHAEEYVEGMWRMLQQDKPEDFILSTGVTNKVRTFIEMTAKHLGWEIEWKGKGIDEKGYDKESGKLLVEVDPKYFRPSEVDRLIGDPSKAKSVLGWETKIDLDELVKRMVEHDLEHE